MPMDFLSGIGRKGPNNNKEKKKHDRGDTHPPENRTTGGGPTGGGTGGRGASGHGTMPSTHGSTSGNTGTNMPGNINNNMNNSTNYHYTQELRDPRDRMLRDPRDRMYPTTSSQNFNATGSGFENWPRDEEEAENYVDPEAPEVEVSEDAIDSLIDHISVNALVEHPYPLPAEQPANHTKYIVQTGFFDPTFAEEYVWQPDMNAIAVLKALLKKENRLVRAHTGDINWRMSNEIEINGQIFPLDALPKDLLPRGIRTTIAEMIDLWQTDTLSIYFFAHPGKGVSKAPLADASTKRQKTADILRERLRETRIQIQNQYIQVNQAPPSLYTSQGLGPSAGQADALNEAVEAECAKIMEQVESKYSARLTRLETDVRKLKEDQRQLDKIRMRNMLDDLQVQILDFMPPPNHDPMKPPNFDAIRSRLAASKLSADQYAADLRKRIETTRCLDKSNRSNIEKQAAKLALDAVFETGLLCDLFNVGSSGGNRWFGQARTAANVVAHEQPSSDYRLMIERQDDLDFRRRLYTVCDVIDVLPLNRRKR